MSQRNKLDSVFAEKEREIINRYASNLSSSGTNTAEDKNSTKKYMELSKQIAELENILEVEKREHDNVLEQIAEAEQETYRLELQLATCNTVNPSFSNDTPSLTDSLMDTSDKSSTTTRSESRSTSSLGSAGTTVGSRNPSSEKETCSRFSQTPGIADQLLTLEEKKPIIDLPPDIIRISEIAKEKVLSESEKDKNAPKPRKVTKKPTDDTTELAINETNTSKATGTLMSNSRVVPMQTSASAEKSTRSKRVTRGSGSAKDGKVDINLASKKYSTKNSSKVPTTELNNPE